MDAGTRLRAATTHPPFSIRGRLLTPLAGGGTLYLSDALMTVDAGGRLERVEATSSRPDGIEAAVDVRPWVLMPGLIDLHAHLPQLPNAGLGAGLDLMAWLERYTFPLEREFDEPTAERVAPAAYRSFAAAGTTTVVLYGAVHESSLDVSFRTAERHGIRAVIGKVMMDRLRYTASVEDHDVLELSLSQTADLIARWHGRDRGRLRYAVTPRFAVSCSAEMLRRSAELARATGTYWQTHLAEDRREVAEVARLFPDALDYTDVYDRAGALGPAAILAHAVHLSDREVERIVAAGARLVHCPSSNLFLSSGAMPLSRYLEAGICIGLGTDVAAGPELSMFSVMRAGAYTQSALRTMRGETRPALTPLDWLRLGTLEGARALGLEAEIGSLEAGKDADFVSVDPSVTSPLPGQQMDEPSDLMSRLIFRTHPEMICGAWVRGRLLEATV
jgi:guanine deaminase